MPRPRASRGSRCVGFAKATTRERDFDVLVTEITDDTEMLARARARARARAQAKPVLVRHIQLFGDGKRLSDVTNRKSISIESDELEDRLRSSMPRSSTSTIFLRPETCRQAIEAGVGLDYRWLRGALSSSYSRFALRRTLGDFSKQKLVVLSSPGAREE